MLAAISRLAEKPGSSSRQIRLRQYFGEPVSGRPGIGMPAGAVKKGVQPGQQVAFKIVSDSSDPQAVALRHDMLYIVQAAVVPELVLCTAMRFPEKIARGKAEHHVPGLLRPAA